jgi:L-ribulose-5-phosphate 4-epimerase
MLETLKKALLEVAVEAEVTGLCQHKSGNFSIRDKETGYVVVTPSGIKRSDLSYHEICVVDLEGHVIEALPGIRPTSELFMHLEIYKSREDVNAVAHTHSKFATSFAVLNKEIPAIIYECATMGLKDGVIPVAPYGRPGTSDLSTSVIEPIKRSDAILLEKHGAVAVDADIKEALLKANYIEELAEIYYRSLVLNDLKEPPRFSPEELEAWQYPTDVTFEGESV